VVVTSFFHPPLNPLPSREGIVFSLTFTLLRPAVSAAGFFTHRPDIGKEPSKLNCSINLSMTSLLI
jgi:hypothetical protein